MEILHHVAVLFILELFSAVTYNYVECHFCFTCAIL